MEKFRLELRGRGRVSFLIRELRGKDKDMRSLFHCWLGLPAAAILVGTCAAAPIAPPTTSGAQQVLSPGVQLAQSTVEIIAPTAPPPPREETIPPPPPGATELSWEPGYWSWSDNQWTWLGGHYVERPSPQAMWEPGHWAEQPNGWLWVQGHWSAVQN
jgi:WXXGXW repeat (2 copies)